jgi:hypothetical protein
MRILVSPSGARRWEHGAPEGYIEGDFADPVNEACHRHDSDRGTAENNLATSRTGSHHFHHQRRTERTTIIPKTITSIASSNRSDGGRNRKRRPTSVIFPQVAAQRHSARQIRPVCHTQAALRGLGYAESSGGPDSVPGVPWRRPLALLWRGFKRAVAAQLARRVQIGAHSCPRGFEV